MRSKPGRVGFMASKGWRPVWLLLLLPLISAALPFKHPGLLNNIEELNFIRDQIKAGAQPWKAAFDQANRSGSASLSYAAHPYADVNCGSYSNPDNGCSEEKADVIAAYTHALLWHFTGQAAHAQKAIEIMNAWSAVIKTHTNSNAPLQSGWAASVFPRAAEIIRYTYTGWAPADVARFTTMLKTAYLPYIQKGSTANGNWELAMIEAILNIAIFNDDQALFDQALTMWRKRVPAYFYLTTDGPSPVMPPGRNYTQAQLIGYWYNQTTFVDGLAQETCRDFGHTQYGIASALNVAETALQQGVDLYAEQNKRLSAAMEFHAAYIMGKAVPAWLCGGKLNLGKNPTWEIGYNHFHNRMTLALPSTLSLINTIRPTGTDHHMAWETLTHAELGSRGLSITALVQSDRVRPGSPHLVFLKAGQFQVLWPGAKGRFLALDGSAIPTR